VECPKKKAASPPIVGKNDPAARSVRGLVWPQLPRTPLLGRFGLESQNLTLIDLRRLMADCEFGFQGC
jgi:hypothetical protein